MTEALCILAAGKIITLAVGAFTLSWTHTVERTEWLEHWQVQSNGLKVVEATIKGSGAGMEPPPDAVWSEDGWHYKPNVPPVRELVLGSSGAGQSVWTLCGGECLTLGAELDQPIKLWSADGAGLCTPAGQ